MLATKTATKTAQDGIWEPESARPPKWFQNDAPIPKMIPQTPHFDPQNDAPDPSFWIDFGIILEQVLLTYSLLFFP